MDFTEYQAIPAINATAIKAGVVSLKHMHAMMHGQQKEQSAAMRWGWLVHAAALENKQFAVFGGAVRRGKEWEAFKADHEQDDIITESERVELDEIKTAVFANPDAKRIIESAKAEVSLKWEGEGYGKAKARLDGYSDEYGVVELKTTTKITPVTFAKQFVGMGYDIQCGWYCEGARLAGLSKKLPPCIVIAVEADKPFDVAVYELPSTVIKVGLSKAKRIATAYRVAEAAGVFPGVSEGVTELVMPSWYGENDVMEAFAEASAAALFGDDQE